MVVELVTTISENLGQSLDVSGTAKFLSAGADAGDITTSSTGEVDTPDVKSKL